MATEEEWNERNEELIEEWLAVCQTQAKKHEIAGYRNKKKDMRWRLPATVIPLVMAPIAGAVTPDIFWGMNYVNAMVFATTAGMTGVYSFFNFQEKTQKHFDFSARYGDLITDIKSELSKERAKRQQVDTFRLRVQMIFDRLGGNAPELPEDMASVVEEV